uniref:Splicing factor Cactin n=1 Tax=Macrostomum lignano TaxID=282301 RepID=A0A1I8FQH5_9PLAT
RCSKAAETPEQKRARRLAKKAAKSERWRRELGWEGDYTDIDNPFGDEKLTQTFVWHKKLQREAALWPTWREKAAENRAELEKVFRRERCRQNELEREARLKEQEQEQRDRESENFRQWWQQEDAFPLEAGAGQIGHPHSRRSAPSPSTCWRRYAEALQRISGIKIKRDDGADDNDDEFDEDESLAFLDAHSPDALLTGLSVDDLEDLKVDIGVYQKLERQSGLTRRRLSGQRDFLELPLLVQHALDSKSAPAASSATAAVADRIDAVIRGKSASQLAALEDSVSARICAAGPGTDLAYWEEMVDKVKVAKAKATLQELHKVLLRRRMQRLQGAEVDDPEVAAASATAATATSSAASEEGAAKPPSQPMTTEAEQQRQQQQKQQQQQQQALDAYDSGRYSPAKLDPDRVAGQIVINWSEESVRLEHLRPSGWRRAQRRAGRENRRDCGENSRPGGLVRPAEAKEAAGYKFNIFYPDLLDKSKAPSYSTEPCKDDPQFCHPALHCWPPYEDVAFKIVRNEWDTSFRHGSAASLLITRSSCTFIFVGIATESRTVAYLRAICIDVLRLLSDSTTVVSANFSSR